jgi:D-glycero-D-manno-heptose 1,7-bisphosphate phosphatase
VLIADRGYVCRIEDIVWLSGAVEAVRLLTERGFLIVVVTNQSAVARGLCTEVEVRALHDALAETVRAGGGRIHAFYYCPFHPDACVPIYRHPDHPWRKPNTGMIGAAVAELSIDLSRSVLIGDRPTDLEAARRAGLRAYLVDESRPLSAIATDICLWSDA